MAFAWSKPSAPECTEPATRWTFRSPGLDLLVDRLSAPGKHEVLDLGGPRAANVAFFQQFACRLHIEDVYPALRDFPADDPLADPEEVARLRASMLDGALCCAASVKLDLVLAWDLFNYLPAAATLGLMTQIAARCRPGTLVYLLMSTDITMSAQPARSAFNADQQIQFELATAQSAPCPGYSPTSLERMMPGFQLLHSFLLAERMQDYLFSFR